LGIIFKALKKSQGEFGNGQNTLKKSHDETLSEITAKDKGYAVIENRLKNDHLTGEIGFYPLSREMIKIQISNRFLFPEEYHKKIV
jgi:hypothetical protein